MKKLALSAVVLSFLVVGCSTKQYPQSPSLTPQETSLMTCKDIKIEISKTESIQREIEATGEFDGKTVLGFLGDFGIGNGIAKSEARKKASDRMWRLQSMKDSKCKNGEDINSKKVYSSNLEDL